MFNVKNGLKCKTLYFSVTPRLKKCLGKVSFQVQQTLLIFVKQKKNMLHRIKGTKVKKEISKLFFKSFTYLVLSEGDISFI